MRKMATILSNDSKSLSAKAQVLGALGSLALLSGHIQVVGMVAAEAFVYVQVDFGPFKQGFSERAML
jgi:hypothetical protein